MTPTNGYLFSDYAGCLLRLGAKTEFKWSTLLDLLERKKIGTDACDEQ